MRVRDGVAFFGKPRSHGQDLGSLILGWPQEVLTCPTSRWHCTRYTSCHIPFVHPREISRQGLIAVDVVVLITENGPVHEASWTLAVGSGIIDFKLWFPSISSASSNGTSTGLVDDVAPEPFEFGARPPDPAELLPSALS